MLVSLPPAVERSFVVQLTAPVDDGTVTPPPPPLVSPYVIVRVEPPDSVTLSTVMVCPETLTLPVLAVVYAAFEPVIDGAGQPLGTSTVMRPPERHPVAAVYVSVNVRPVWLADTVVGDTVIVPLPSAAYTVIEGEPDVMLVSEPAPVDFSLPCQVAAPVLEGTVAPEPPPLVSP